MTAPKPGEAYFTLKFPEVHSYVMNLLSDDERSQHEQVISVFSKEQFRVYKEPISEIIGEDPLLFVTTANNIVEGFLTLLRRMPTGDNYRAHSCHVAAGLIIRLARCNEKFRQAVEAVGLENLNFLDTYYPWPDQSYYKTLSDACRRPNIIHKESYDFKTIKARYHDLMRETYTSE